MTVLLKDKYWPIIPEHALFHLNGGGKFLKRINTQCLPQIILFSSFKTLIFMLGNLNLYLEQLVYHILSDIQVGVSKDPSNFVPLRNCTSLCK